MSRLREPRASGQPSFRPADPGPRPTPLSRVTRMRVAVALTVSGGLLAATFPGLGLAGSHTTRVSRTVDTGLCPFPLQITVAGASSPKPTSVLRFELAGPSTITLRNGRTGRRATLRSSGTYSTNAKTGSLTFRGHNIWLWSTGDHVPFMSTDGTGSLVAPDLVLSRSGASAHVIDPCALVSASPPSTRPATTRAPWGLPPYALSQLAYAGLTPLLGNLVRHDHVHVDLIVNGKKITIPAGVGLVQPVGNGPCPPSPLPQGDCATRNIFTAQVANSPLHTHSTSGIIHVEPDRPGRYTLGQFFDEWGVRLSSTCVGGYCTGSGKELRVFVNGKREARPRNIVLTDLQEIAIVFGSPGDFSAVPSRYNGGWPGLGCGGAHEPSCLAPRTG